MFRPANGNNHPDYSLFNPNITKVCNLSTLHYLRRDGGGMPAKTMMVMKLTAMIHLAVCLQVSATGLSQNVTLSFRNAPLERIFKEVKKQTGYNFIYTRELLEATGTVTIKVKDLPLQLALERCFQDLPVTFVIQANFI